jgi:hypothetical protein
MTRAEYARHAQVNKATVTRWVQSGRIRLEPSGLLDPEAADRMRAATESPLPHHQARKAQIDAAKAEQTAPGERAAAGEYSGTATAQIAPPAQSSQALLGKDEVTHRRNVAVMLEREWTARQKEIEARRAAGELYERARVRAAWRSAFVTLRAVLEAMPDRAAPELAARRGDVAAIHADLSGMMADVLREVSDTFERKLMEAV